MLELIDQILQRSGFGEVLGVCLVVRTRGSTPQRTGAMMLVLQDGRTTGTLGGGCVEMEVKTQALRLMQQGGSKLLSFKLDHDYGWDDGLVCGGSMDVAVQTINSPAQLAAWEAAAADAAADRPAIVRIEVGDEAGKIETFEHPLPPKPMLLLAGAGHVAQALGRLAPSIGFRTTVIDDRSDFACADRFPAARCIIGDIERELKSQPIDDSTYIVIVTRGHRHDAAALAAVIHSPAKYIGMIGSKRKIHTILRDLHAQGVPREKLAAVRAPIGLNISAVGPEEIAVSIAAELIAVRRAAGTELVTPMKVSAEMLDRWLASE